MWVHFGRRGWPGLAVAALCAAAAGPARAQILTSVQTITPNSGPGQTVTDPRDHTIWFVEQYADHIGTITPSRAYIGEVNLRLPGSRPSAIALDSKGTAWFTESGLNKIGAYTRASVITVCCPLAVTMAWQVQRVDVEVLAHVQTEKIPHVRLQ